MNSGKKAMLPVKPVRMEIIYIYPCPFCGRELPLASPTQPALAHCDMCKNQYPVVPIDERMTRFLKLVNADGKAAIDQDYL
ncbi:hypothetical protein SAMN05660653_01253 [Desulfonatronum thiosulfatophilum]|uniref:Uncharacterized protein n=1 Tax=Desulfonatronum thiosulfatophilum TaxID=617002 RepID=A0A1G6C063_9BACT|nr:hypothetical protein [Desulfonatronum thiosulfatophilum]SDB26251.1 hypothetical protein SAMN05660653_01253 [Desulfonatronum thiosulfatophilum]